MAFLMRKKYIRRIKDRKEYLAGYRKGLEDVVFVFDWSLPVRAFLSEPYWRGWIQGAFKGLGYGDDNPIF